MSMSTYTHTFPIFEKKYSSFISQQRDTFAIKMSISQESNNNFKQLEHDDDKRKQRKKFKFQLLYSQNIIATKSS